MDLASGIHCETVAFGVGFAHQPKQGSLMARSNLSGVSVDQSREMGHSQNLTISQSSPSAASVFAL